MATEPTTTEIDLETMRHSFAHVLAMATVRLYPEARLGIGPATKNGFYYEFEISPKISQQDLEKIENEMRKIIAEEIPFKQIVIEREQAFNTLVQLGQIYKTELLQSITDQQISFFKTGNDFIDMCRGPHVQHTGQLGVFKLTSVTDVHWFGDNARPTLQKVEGIGFSTPEEMAVYETKQENIKLRDHRRLGLSLSLFIEEAKDKQSSVHWLSKGLTLKNVIKKTVNDTLQNSNFVETETPLETSNTIRSSMLEGAYSVFKSHRRSYKELPVKIFENGIAKKVQNDEPSYGLYDISPRNTTEAFTFTAAHDLVTEIAANIELNKSLYENCGVTLSAVQLCVPDLSGVPLSDKEKKILNDDFQILKSNLIESEIDFDMATKKPFIYYSPYISFVAQDLHEREWEIGKITIAYNPKGPTASATNSRNNQEKVIVIYNSLITSYERLIAHLTESLDGGFPMWMSPVQVDLLSLSEKYNQYVSELHKELTTEGIRCSINVSNSTIQTKIRKSQMQKTPYMLIIGEKEIKTNSISLRNRDGQELGLIRIDEFITKIKSEINIEKKPPV